jgi:1,4-alpha-glucan branching enzyme
MPYADASGTGYSFRVWAPNATSVKVVGDFNNWQFSTDLVDEGDGHWSCDVEGARAGQEFKYYLNGSLWRKDPRSRYVTSRENSQLVDPDTYSWSDSGFVRPAKDDLVIYELHPGSFYDPTPSDNDVATFNDVLAKLDYLTELGVNCIQLMPISRFPGDRSWGYNPIDLFAIENSYGTPQQFRQFVDACHERGMAVYLDVVHNHYDASNGDCDLWEFDGWFGSGNYGGIYFYQEDGKCCTIWGRRPHFGRQGVRDFITDNIRMWLDEYHVDGFRWDSPMNIKFYDEDTFNVEGYSLLFGINQMIKDEYPGRLSMGEDQNLNNNFDSEWHDSFHYNVVGQLTAGDDTERDMWAVANNIATEAGFYRVIYTETHDKVGKLNNDTRLVSKIDPADPTGYFARKRAALGAVLTFTSPGIPLLFMGQEWFEYEPFDDFDPLDWDRADSNIRGRLLFKHLIHLRRNLYGASAGLKGTGLDVPHVNDSAKVIAFHRWNQHGTNDDVVVAANFSIQTWSNYEIEFPYTGRWYTVFNSDATLYANDYSNTGLDYIDVTGEKAAIQLAPYSAVIMSRTPITPFDVDKDSMPDEWETDNGLNPANPADAAQDPDGDGLTNREEFEHGTDPNVYSPLHLYDTMNLPGTDNNWNLTAAPMQLTTHYTWQTVRHLVDTSTLDFKFAAGQSWSTCWGDADQAAYTLPLSGSGDPGGDELPISLSNITAGSVVRFAFIETNLAYQVQALPSADNDADQINDHWEAFYGLNTNDPSDAALDPDNDGFTNLEEFQNDTHPLIHTPRKHDYNTINLAGIFNDWDITRLTMKLFENYGWEIVQPLQASPGATFKFVGNQDWANTWGETNQYDTNLPIEEYALWQGEDIRINDALNGVYRFRFNQKSTAYSVEFMPFIDHDVDGMHDDWEAFYDLSTNSPSDAALDADHDGFTNLEEYQYGTSPLVADPLRASYDFVAVAGTFNGWSTSSNKMSLVDNYLWDYTLTITNPGIVEIKFTADRSWSNNWGYTLSTNQLPFSGIAEPYGDNISFNVLYEGDYHIQFDDRTLQFHIAFVPRSDYTSVTVPGTFCNWDPTANSMTLVGNYLWQLDTFFNNASNAAFKFVADKDWALNWGDDAQAVFTLPVTGTGTTPYAANIIISNTLNGTYRFQFNEATAQYSVSLLAPADHDADGIPDYWEEQFGLNATNYADAHLDSDGDSLSNLQEYIAGTAPNDSGSSFEIISLASGNQGITVRWKGGEDVRQYLMVADPAHPDTWDVIYTNIPPTPVNMVVSNLPATSSRWFRLKAVRE